MSSTLILVGMSGVGKSYWSEALAREHDYYREDIDTLIARDLGLSDVAEVGVWLGMPHSSEYEEKAQHYLRLEHEHTLSALNRAQQREAQTVIDSTGSIVHLDPALLQRLREEAFILHLDITPQEQDGMLEVYLGSPKPVMFADHYRALEEEEPEEALARSYGALLSWRMEQYRALAHESALAYDPSIWERIQSFSQGKS